MLFLLIKLAFQEIQYSVTNDVLKISGNGEIDKDGVQKRGDFSKITEVIIENGPTKITRSSFDGCISLTKITIPESITEIIAPFYRCEKLKYIIVDVNNQYYCSENDILYSKNKTILIRAPIQQIKIADSVELIKEYSFANQNKFTYDSISMPDSLIQIEQNAFAESIVGSITWGNNPKLEKMTGFFYSTISTLTVPSSCKELSDRFLDGSNVTNLVFQEVSNLKTVIGYAFSAAKISSIVFPDSLERVEDNAFSQCTELQNITFGTKIKYISTKAFTGCTNMKKLTIPQGNEYYVTSDGTTMTSSGTDIIFIEPEATNVVLSANINNINPTLLQGLKLLTSLTIKGNNPNYDVRDGVLYTKNYIKLLAVCGGVESVTAHQNVQELCDSCCYECTKLKTFAFESEENCATISAQAFRLSGITSFSLPNRVTTIAGSAFRNCQSLKSFEIKKESQLTSFGIYAFYGSTIKSIYIPKGVKVIAQQLFDLSSLNEITFADDSTCNTILYGAFTNTKIQSITLPSSIGTIGENAFKNCQQLESIDFQNNNVLTEIPKSAFYNCKKLSLIDIPSSCSKIKSQAFSNCSLLTNVTNNAAEIDSQAFEYCTSLVKFTFSSSIREIDAGTFRGCTSLVEFDVQKGNPYIKTKDGVVFNYNEDTLMLFPPGVEEAIITKTTKEFNERSFAYSEKLSRVIFTNGNTMTTFKEFTFLECVALTDVQFPSELQTISNNCFENCTSLVSIVFPSSLQNILQNAFSGCSALKTLKYCGNSQIATTNAFDAANTHLIIYVTYDYIYNEFCSKKVEKILSESCDIIPKLCEKRTCKISKRKSHISLYLISILLSSLC